MSRRPRRLPLKDRRWLPLTAAYPRIYRLTGDCRLAARDLNAALASERMRSMRRRSDGGGPDELLSSSFWVEHGIRSFKEHFLVMPRGNRTLEISSVFYVWEPDFKKIWSWGYDIPPATKGMQEKPEKSGRPGTTRWQELRVEIVRRCWRAGKFVAPEKQIVLVLDLQKWHRRKFKSEPNHEDLRKFVGDAIAILKLTGR